MFESFFFFIVNFSWLIGLVVWVGLGLFGFVVDEVFVQDFVDMVNVQQFIVEVFGQGLDVFLILGLSCGGDVWQGIVELLQGEYWLYVVILFGFVGMVFWLVEVFFFESLCNEFLNCI